RSALERAQKLAPEDAAIAAELRELYLELGDDAASDGVAGARDRGYFLAQARQALASLALTGALADAARATADGDTAAAKRALMLASPADKATASYEFLRGEVLLVDGELERAEKSFRAVVARDDA